jgi:hypothetical protein
LEFRGKVLRGKGIFRTSQRKVGIPTVLGVTILRAQGGKCYENTHKQKVKSTQSTGKWISWSIQTY